MHGEVSPNFCERTRYLGFKGENFAPFAIEFILEKKKSFLHYFLGLSLFPVYIGIIFF